MIILPLGSGSCRRLVFFLAAAHLVQAVHLTKQTLDDGKNPGTGNRIRNPG
jgi:hypothetical protein